MKTACETLATREGALQDGVPGYEPGPEVPRNRDRVGSSHEEAPSFPIREGASSVALLHMLLDTCNIALHATAMYAYSLLLEAVFFMHNPCVAADPTCLI